MPDVRGGKPGEERPPGEKAESGAPSRGWAVGDRFSWDEILERLLAGADEEIGNSVRKLFFSGFAAGFAIVLTIVGYSVGTARFPDNAFLAALLYPIGFVYIILGQYQLYTENTLPPVKLVLKRMASLPLLLRVWGVVLLANLAGAAFGMFILANSGVLSPEAQAAALELATHGIELPWWDVFFKGLFAGWLVAGVVWLNYAARDTSSRLLLIYFVFYTIAVTELYHVVTTAAEIAFAAFGEVDVPLGRMVVDYLVPTMLGNKAGGVLVFTLVNYGQSGKKPSAERGEPLSFREMLFSLKGGRPDAPAGREGSSPEPRDPARNNPPGRA